MVGGMGSVLVDLQMKSTGWEESFAISRNYIWEGQSLLGQQGPQDVKASYKIQKKGKHN